MKTSKHAAVMDSCICGCGGDACIPQRTETPPRHVPQETILFSVNGKCGYSLSDALKERYTNVDGRGDRTFVDCKTYISLRLEVRLPIHQYYPKIIPRPVCSGYRMRGGQGRLVAGSSVSLHGY